MNIYINGILSKSGTIQVSGITYNGGHYLDIGYHFGEYTSDVSNGFYPNYFNGLIDDVRIYNYARTPAQIAWDYNRGAPIAWWKMDDGQNSSTTCDGTTGVVSDSSGNGSTGTLTNSASPAASWIDGKYNCAIDFDGDDDVVTVTQNSTINLTNKTGYAISVWVYPHSDGEGHNGQIIQKGTSNLLAVNNQSNGYLNLTGKIDLVTTDASTTIQRAIPINAWSNVVMVFTTSTAVASKVDLYVNGVLKGTSTNGNGPTATDSNNLSIAGATTANFDGLIDDVRLYNYSPTSAQIKTIYNEGAAVRFGPLEGLP